MLKALQSGHSGVCYFVIVLCNFISPAYKSLTFFYISGVWQELCAYSVHPNCVCEQNIPTVFIFIAMLEYPVQKPCFLR